MAKSDHVLCILCFCAFDDFTFFTFFMFCAFCHFDVFDVLCSLCNKALCVIEGGRELCVVVLPSLWVFSDIEFTMWTDFVSGRIHRVDE